MARVPRTCSSRASPSKAGAPSGCKAWATRTTSASGTSAPWPPSVGRPLAARRQALASVSAKSTATALRTPPVGEPLAEWPPPVSARREPNVGAPLAAETGKCTSGRLTSGLQTLSQRRGDGLEIRNNAGVCSALATGPPVPPVPSTAGAFSPSQASQDFLASRDASCAPSAGRHWDGLSGRPRVPRRVRCARAPGTEEEEEEAGERGGGRGGGQLRGIGDPLAARAATVAARTSERWAWRAASTAALASRRRTCERSAAAFLSARTAAAKSLDEEGWSVARDLSRAAFG